jgi:hypothetical protein
MKELIDFLEKNGFVQNSDGTWFNGISSVRVDDICYRVECFDQDFGEDGVMFSTDLNIYWLIGVLTYYNLIEKDYKI